MLALQAMAELSAMTFGGDLLRLDVGLDAGGVHYKFETITKANAGILQSKQVRLYIVLLAILFYFAPFCSPTRKSRFSFFFMVHTSDNEKELYFLLQEMNSRQSEMLFVLLLN